MSYEEEERRYMKEALTLAAKGKGMAHPNPMVGCVVVKKGRVVGRGYHRGPFTPHAEVVALREAGKSAAGADLYVNLEPCNHRGRTPPCTVAILDAGIKRVVAAMHDPNPNVKGGGIRRLRSGGVMAETGLLEDEARELNAAYIKHAVTGLPLVMLKAAVTADGKVAARGGASRWITGEKARRTAHIMRRESDAVLVGRGTVEADDPELTVRMVPLGSARPPLRVVVDSNLSMDLRCRLAQGGEPRVILATTPRHDIEKAAALRERGVEILVTAERDGRVDLRELIAFLGKMDVVQILVEGGPTLATSFLEEGLVDRLALFVAPRVFADEEAMSWAAGRVVTDPSQALPMRWRRVRRLGEDILMEAEMGSGG